MQLMADRGLNPIKKGASAVFRRGRTVELPDYLSVSKRRIRPFSDTIKYGNATGRIRALEVRYIDTGRLERLIDAGYQEALDILEEVPIGAFLKGASDAGQVDEGIAAYLRHLYDMLDEMLPKDSWLGEFFRCRYDFHNLKVLLKARTFRQEKHGLLEGLGTLKLDKLEKGIEDPGALSYPYKDAVEEVLGREATSQQLDCIIDRSYFAYRLFLAEREGSPLLVDFARSSIDLANLKALLRVIGSGEPASILEESLAEGGFIAKADLMEMHGETREGLISRLSNTPYYAGLLEILQEEEELGLVEFDRRSDDYLMDMVRGTKRFSVGIEPVFAYVRSRENEAVVVRTVLMSKLLGMPPETVESMLRKLFREH